MSSNHFDILIIGAGPAGTTCALALKDSGLKIGIIDKAVFPRDKICGDAIPGPSFKVLNSISTDLGAKMHEFKLSTNIRASRIYAPNNKSFTINWITKSYNSKRIDFDNFLFRNVVQLSNAEIFGGVKVKTINKENGIFHISGVTKTKVAFRCSAQLIIGADGANSIVAKQLSSFTLDRNHHCAAVRAYFSNIKGLSPGVNEFHMVKKYIPGYFWIFPLPNGWANVGFGMLTKKITSKQLDLKKAFRNIFEEHPNLKKRFDQSIMQGEIKGFGLPLGSRMAPLTGDGYMLIGDAGSLIDPLQGHGIDKAMISGKMAAERAEACFATDRFDKLFLEEYEKKLYSKLSGEFRRNYLFLKVFAKFPFFLDFVIWLAQNPLIKKLFQKFT